MGLVEQALMLSAVEAPTLNVVGEFIKVVGEWLKGILTLLTDSFMGVVQVFWSDTTGFTIYGVLLLCGMAVGFVSLGLFYIIKLIKK